MSLNKIASFAAVAVFAASALSTATIVTSSDATAATCLASFQSITAVGDAGGFGGRGAKRRATRRAIRAWEREAEKKFGSSFDDYDDADLRKSNGQKFSTNFSFRKGKSFCTNVRGSGGQSGRMVCTVTAVPCNG